MPGFKVQQQLLHQHQHHPQQQQQQRLQHLAAAKVQVPHYFRCPISLDLMRDPVTVATGQTYDRASIEKWVADGNTTCPATMQQLHDLTLIPNHTLRRLIQEWCVANRARGVERIPTPKQPADPRRIEALLREVGDPSMSMAALRTLRVLAKESDRNRASMVEAGGPSILLSALFNEDSAPGVAEEALAVLAALPMGDAERAEVGGTTARLAALSRLLRQGRSMEARINAASIVERAASTSSADDGGAAERFKRAAGETEGLMEGLVALLAAPPRAAAKAGVRAIFSLCLCASSANSERAVAAGAAALLVEHLPEASSPGDVDRTLGALELLCRTNAGREAVGGHALAVPALVGAILRGASFQATECAAGTLLAVCSASAEVQRAAVECGVLTQLLLLIQSDCTERAKRKAMELLKLLRGSWADDPCLSELERTDVVAF